MYVGVYLTVQVTVAKNARSRVQSVNHTYDPEVRHCVMASVLPLFPHLVSYFACPFPLCMRASVACSFCKDSCQAQAWSIATVLAFVGDLICDPNDPVKAGLKASPTAYPEAANELE